MLSTNHVAAQVNLILDDGGNTVYAENIGNSLPARSWPDFGAGNSSVFGFEKPLARRV